PPGPGPGAVRWSKHDSDQAVGAVASILDAIRRAGQKVHLIERLKAAHESAKIEWRRRASGETMVLNSLSGLPAFLIYLIVGSVLIAAYLYLYTLITPHDEFALVRTDKPGAAISLGLSMIGFALPLTSSIAHSDGIIDMAIWGVIALLVQIAAY